MVNAVPVSDRFGNLNSACYFNGVNAYIELPYSNFYNFSPSGSYSMSVWVLPDQNNTWPAQAIVVKAPPHPDFTLSNWNYGIYLFNYRAMSGFAYNHVLNGSTTFINNICWYNIITTYNNGIWHLYVNGRLEASNTSQNRFILQDGSSRIAFGRKGQSSGDWYKGKIDDVRIYDRVLNQAEIDSLSYNVTGMNAGDDATICEGSSHQLNATGFSTYSWSPSAGLSNTSIPNPVATPSATTLYRVTGTNAAGCIAADEVLITVQPKPEITLTNDTVVCANTPVQLQAGGGTQYSWTPSTGLSNPSVSNPIANPLATTWYYVTVSTGAGCSSNDSLLVTIYHPAPDSVSPASSVCLNNSVQLNAFGGHTYNWSPSTSLDNPLISNPISSPDATTIFTVTIADTICHTINTLNTTITVNPLPVITASKSGDFDCINNKIQLFSTGGTTYNWDPAPTLTNTQISNPFVYPIQPTLYKVTGTDANGCKNRDSIRVNFNNTSKNEYFLPNAFTPNNDGLNDCFRLKMWGALSEIECSIFNRWGERIFYSTSPDFCWDGTYKGIMQNPGVYVYMIRAKSGCGEIFKNGTFTLIR